MRWMQIATLMGMPEIQLCALHEENSKQMVPKPALALPIRPGQKLISFSIFFYYVDLLHE